MKLTVNNVLKEIRIFNVFGVIKGFEEPGKDPCFCFVYLFVCVVLVLKNVAGRGACRKAGFGWVLWSANSCLS